MKQQLRQRLRMVIGVAFVTCAVIIAAGLKYQRHILGRVVVEPESYNVTRADGESDNRVVTLLLGNSTAEAVVVEKVSSSCGCTVPQVMEGIQLPSGHSLSIPISLNLPQYGERSSVVTIVVYEPEEKKRTPFMVPIHMEGSSGKIPYVSYIPTFVDGNRVCTTSEVQHEFELITMERAGASHWLTDVASTNPQVIASLIPLSIEPVHGASATIVERRYRCFLRAELPLMQDARVNTQLTFGPNGPETFATLKRRLPVQAVPEAVLFSLPTGAELNEKTVNLFSVGDDQVQITEFSTSAPWLTIVGERIDERHMRLKVKVDEAGIPSQQKVLSSSIEITAEQNSEFRIRIPVTLNVDKAASRSS